MFFNNFTNLSAMSLKTVGMNNNVFCKTKPIKIAIIAFKIKAKHNFIPYGN